MAVSRIVYSWTFAATFLASAANSCVTNINYPAVCSADVTNVIASLAVVASAGSRVNNTCGSVGQSSIYNPYGFLTGRRLSPEQSANESEEALSRDTPEMLRFSREALRVALAAHQVALGSNFSNDERVRELVKEAQGHVATVRKMQSQGAAPTFLSRAGQALQTASQVESTFLTECVLKGLHMAMWLTRAAVGIAIAIKDCGPLTPKNLNWGLTGGPALCPVDISAIVQSFSFTASYISELVGKCPILVNNLDAMCASDIAMLVAGVSGLGTSAWRMHQSCGAAGNLAQAFTQTYGEAKAPVIP